MTSRNTTTTTDNDNNTGNRLVDSPMLKTTTNATASRQMRTTTQKMRALSAKVFRRGCKAEAGKIHTATTATKAAHVQIVGEKRKRNNNDDDDNDFDDGDYNDMDTPYPRLMNGIDDNGMGILYFSNMCFFSPGYG